MSNVRHAFVTGFPGFIGTRLLKKLLATDDGLKVTALVEHARMPAAEAQLARLGGIGTSGGLAGRVHLVGGDITAMDVGLSGSEFRSLISEVTEVYHLAAIHRLGVDRPTAERVNVQGTRNVLDLARAMKSVERFVHFSSAYVSGDRIGVILEEELSEGQSFRNPYEATKFQAELLVRDAMRKLPISIVRPAAVVGDSRSGEIDRFDGVYHLGLLLVASPAGIPIPLPGDGSAPLNLVPVDYLVDTVHAITSQPDTIGKTFHVVDPNPMSVRSIYAAIAKQAGRKTPRYGVSPNLTKALLRIPGLERIAPVGHQAIDYLNHMAFYNSANVQDALEGTGIRCPRFELYVDKLVRFVREYYEKEPATRRATVDQS